MPRYTIPRTAHCDGGGLAVVLADPPAPRGPRDLSTVLWRRGRLSVVLEPRDLWWGLYFAPKAVYVCLVPCLPLKWERRRAVPQGGAERPSMWLPGRWG